MDDIEFVDEPPRRRGRPGFNWGPTVAKLVANEGQWAKCRSYPTPQSAASAASYIRNGGGRYFRGYRWDARSSAGDLYVKCLGPVEP